MAFEDKKYKFPRALWIWQLLPQLTWCRTEEQAQFCKLVCQKAFTKSGHNLWDDLDFAITVLKWVGILKEAEGNEYEYVDSLGDNADEVDFGLIAWAFAFFKTSKGHSPEACMTRIFNKVKNEKATKVQSGLGYLYRLWR